MSELSIENTKSSSLSLTASLYMLMLTYAVSTTMIGPLMPLFIKEFNLAIASGGLITSFQGFGGVVSILVGSVFLDRMKKLNVVTGTYLIYCLSVLLIAFTGSYALLVFLFFIIGATTKLMDAAINSSIVDMYREKRGLFVNLLHTFFGVGALLGPLFTAWLINRGESPARIFMALAIFCLMFLLVYLGFLRKSPFKSNQPTSTNRVNPLIFLRDKRVISMGMAGFSYTALSASLSTWMPYYMQSSLEISPLLSSLPVTLFGVGIVVGRLFFSKLAHLKKSIEILFASHLVCAGLWILAFLLNSATLMIVAAGIAGLCVSGVVPISVSIVCGWYPAQTGSITSLVFLFVTLGYVVMPTLVGVIAQFSTMWIALLVLGLVPFMSALFIKFVLKNMTEKQFAA